MSELVGRVFAGYRIESVIGRGAMGTVYLAEDERLQRKVALKVLAPELVHQDAFWQRFLRETRIATALDHPHVVPVYDAGDAEGTPFLAMRYVEGSDLRALLRRAGPLEPRRALAIVAQVARALDAAHARGLVHRDVKPGNVLIAEDEHAYLADFGVSVELDAPRAHPGSPVGTVAYLAPEQIEGATVDGRADQYALACVLFECVCGEPPFTRADSDMAVLWAHLEDEPRPLGELRPGLPAALDGVLAKALAKDPRARFATCQAFADAAMEALGESAALPPALAAQKAPLIGRAAELAWLREAWARKGVALLSGPRGSGKTRLAAELARIAQAEGAEVHYASCLDGPPPAVGEGLLVIEDLDAAGDDVLREAGDSVFVLGTRRTDAPGYRRLEPLDRRALRELIGLYTDAADAPVDRIAEATGGLPGPAHELAAEWARAEVARRVRASADRAADERTSLRDAEADLAQDVIEIQLVRERARLYVPEAHPSARSQTACPFMGLGSFGATDADVFFGRERLVAQLVAALAGSRFLAIVGPSGSGKSSALRAGLLPALAGGVLPGSEQWEQAVIRPGERVPATGLVAIDQFEELFTGALDEDERAAFIASIAASEAVVVVALRADFYGRCSAYPELRDLLANHHVLVGPMTADELRRTIELPAAGAGLQVERELADALVRDVSGEPGALPLLSTALVELWSERDGATLTIDAYERSGGVRGAVARMAEAAYDELDAALRPACRRAAAADGQRGARGGGRTPPRAAVRARARHPRRHPRGARRVDRPPARDRRRARRRDRPRSPARRMATAARLAAVRRGRATDPPAPGQRGGRMGRGRRQPGSALPRQPPDRRQRVGARAQGRAEHPGGPVPQRRLPPGADRAPPPAPPVAGDVQRHHPARARRAGGRGDGRPPARRRATPGTHGPVARAGRHGRGALGLGPDARAAAGPRELPPRADARGERRVASHAHPAPRASGAPGAAPL